MTDSRYVNPEYQLDVDVMILEYLLYQALRAQFDALRAKHENGHHDGIDAGKDDDRMFKAQRLLKTFDSFAQIFRHNHYDYSLSSGTAFSLAILETIVLLKISRDLSHISSLHNDPASSDIRIPESMRDQWLKEQSEHLEHRRKWSYQRGLLVKSKDPSVANPQSDILNQFDDSSWNAFQTTHVIPNCSEPIVPLFSILHRFMSLSAELAPVTGDINEKWMKLALQLMLQSALEVFSVNDKSEALQPAREASMSSTYETSMPGLISCFSFGFPGLPFPTKPTLSNKELDINGMFIGSSLPSSSRVSSDPYSRRANYVENPVWSHLRSQTLSEFQLLNPPASKAPLPTLNPESASTTQSIPSSLDAQPFDAIDPAPFIDRLAHLKHKYPYAPFEANLLRCLEHFWILNCSESVSGKPVLLQIEEGRLDGLGDEEFAEFLVRTGIRRDESGKVLLQI